MSTCQSNCSDSQLADRRLQLAFSMEAARECIDARPSSFEFTLARGDGGSRRCAEKGRRVCAFVAAVGLTKSRGP